MTSNLRFGVVRRFWFGLWCLSPLSKLFQLYLYHGGQFYWWRKPEYPETTTHNFSGDRHWLHR